MVHALGLLVPISAATLVAFRDGSGNGKAHRSLAGHHQHEHTYTIRPFDSSKDYDQLAEICRNVFRGTDYLPSQAKSLEQNPLCQFQVLVSKEEALDTDPANKQHDDQHRHEREKLLAVANLRSLNKQVGWIEAVRTCEQNRSRGLATLLLRDLLFRVAAKEECYRTVMTCTIESNTAMQRVFHRLQMEEIGRLAVSDFIEIAKLPGYPAKDTSTPARNLLDALNIRQLVPQEAKQVQWKVVQDAKELDSLLQQVSANHDTTSAGWMPGIWKCMGSKTPQLQDSLERGLVFAMEEDDDDDSTIHTAAAVMALVQDKPMDSLKSPWVLCLAGSSEIHLFAALWYASTSEKLQAKLLEPIIMTTTGSDNHSSVEKEAGFVVSLDASINLSKELLMKFPLRQQDDPLIYAIDFP